MKISKAARIKDRTRTCFGRMRIASNLYLSFLLFLAISAVVHADDFAYRTLGTNRIVIVGYTGSGGEVAMPEAINGLPVTDILGGAFKNCTNLTSLQFLTASSALGGHASVCAKAALA